MDTNTLSYNDIESTTKNCLDLVLFNAREKLGLGLRDFKVMEYYKFWSSCIDYAITIFKDSLIYCYDLPYFYNIEPTPQEKEKWKDDSDECTFNGMWYFFGYRLPVYCDDYGQQDYIKFEDKEGGKVVELYNGSYCISSDNVAYQVVDYIKNDYIHQLKEIVNELTNFNIEGLIELDNKGIFKY